MAKTEEKNEKLVAGLSYILIGIIWYFIDDKIKKSEFAKFHVKQAMNFILIGFLVSAAINVVSQILFDIFDIIEQIVGLIFLILWIIAIINVINHESKRIPLIGVFAEKYLKF